MQTIDYLKNTIGRYAWMRDSGHRVRILDVIDVGWGILMKVNYVGDGTLGVQLVSADLVVGASEIPTTRPAGVPVR